MVCYQDTGYSDVINNKISIVLTQLKGSAFLCCSLFIFLFYSSAILAQDEVVRPCPELNFLTPQCCFTPKSVITFNWEGGCTNSQVNLYLIDPVSLSVIVTIATSLPNSGHYTWTVPGIVPLGNYLLYIEDVGPTTWDYGAEVIISKDCLGDKCNCLPDFDFLIKEDGCSISFISKFKDNCKIENLLWEFGDNNSSTDINPVHTYSQNGDYWVCLTVTFVDLSTKETCTEKICKEVILETCLDCCPVIPTFSFEVEGCLVKFTSLNLENECSKVTSRSWDFGDGSPPLNQIDPTHTYSSNGTYNACLTSTIQTNDEIIFQTILCRTVTIDDCNDGCCPITSIFNYDINPNEPCRVQFSGNVIPENCADQINWLWNFGDGNNSNLQNPTHEYNSNGEYEVCLLVQYGNTNTVTCENRFCQNIQVSNCLGDTTGCNLSGIIISQNNINCNNTTGGSVVVQGINGTAPYNYTLNSLSQSSGAFTNLSQGQHTIQINDANNCSTSIAVTIISEDVVSVTTVEDETICLGGSYQLSATPMGTFQWSPSTGLSCVTCPNPNASPSITTTYTVNHIDLNGCLSSDQVTISVIDSFEFDLPDVVICPGDTEFLNPNPIPGYYLWHPPSGLSCTNCPNPEVTLTHQQTYTVTIIDGECVGTDELTVYMHSSIGADFSWLNEGECSVNFVATTSGLNSYTWDFGDPDSGQDNYATGVQVNHIFSTPNQNYTICLIAKDECGPIRICHQIFIDVDCKEIIQKKKDP